NSNSCWDREHGSKSHSVAVERLSRLGLESAYHIVSGHQQGAEKQPTFWFRKSRRAPFHIDYVFLNRSLLSKLKGVTIGLCDDWLFLSDHAPVSVEIDL